MSRLLYVQTLAKLVEGTRDKTRFCREICREVFTCMHTDHKNAPFHYFLVSVKLKVHPGFEIYFMK